MPIKNRIAKMHNGSSCLPSATHCRSASPLLCTCRSASRTPSSRNCAGLLYRLVRGTGYQNADDPRRLCLSDGGVRTGARPTSASVRAFRPHLATERSMIGFRRLHLSGKTALVTGSSDGVGRTMTVSAMAHEQSVPIFQQLARGHPSGRDDVRAIPDVASKRRGSLGRARDRHQPRDRPVGHQSRRETPQCPVLSLLAGKLSAGDRFGRTASPTAILKSPLGSLGR